MKQRAGFVLIAALWLIVALSAVGLDSALRAQARRAPALSQLDAVRSREAASAGVEFARSRLTAVLLNRAEELRVELGEGRRGGSVRSILTALSQEDPWADPQRLVPELREFGDAEFTLEMRDAGDRLNINEATEDMIRALLSQGLRVDYATADRVAQAVMDWRDADDHPRVSGAEREQYIEAGAAVMPSNHAFSTIDELRHVLGITPELYATIAPYVTVTGSGRVNINAAPEPVLHALPTLTPAAVSQLLRMRESGYYAYSRGSLAELLGRTWQPEQGGQELMRHITYATNEVEITVTGRTTASQVSSRVRALAIRADRSAMVVWRRFE